MKRIIALILPILWALASCDNDMEGVPTSQLPADETTGGQVPPYIVNEAGDTLYHISPQIEIEAKQDTRSVDLACSYDLGKGLQLEVIPDTPQPSTRATTGEEVEVDITLCVLVYTSDTPSTFVTKMYYKGSSSGHWASKLYDMAGSGSPYVKGGGLYLPKGNYQVYCIASTCDYGDLMELFYPNDIFTKGLNTDDKTLAYSPLTMVYDLAWNSTPTTLTVGIASPYLLKITLPRQNARISKVTFTTNDATTKEFSISDISLLGVYPNDADVKRSLTSLQSTTQPTADVAWGLTDSVQVADAPTLTCEYKTPWYLIPQSSKVGFAVTLNGYKYKIDNALSKLEAGKSYTLKFTYTPPNMFAYSNVFWDGKGLNFYTEQGKLARDNKSDTYTLDTSTDPQRYQGMYFWWGSLVALFPSNPADAESDMILYYPDYSTNGGYQPATQMDATSFISAGISYRNGPKLPSNITTAYANNGYHSDDNNYNGDVCAYITQGKWREPWIDDITTLRSKQGQLYEHDGIHCLGFCDYILRLDGTIPLPAPESTPEEYANNLNDGKGTLLPASGQFIPDSRLNII
ncbi:MAG: fimbrillin family protein [Mediterranea sp.]|nr:fimbrillin family protein [Mediterranea sp.]